MRTHTKVGTAASARVAVVVLLLVAACGTATPWEPPGATGGPGPWPSTTDGESVCFTEAGTREDPTPFTVGERRRPDLPADFTPVSAVLCELGFEQVPGQGEWHVRVRHTISGDLAPLLAALRVPDEPAYDGPCTAQWDPDPALWLLDGQGRAVRPGWPRDACRHLQPRPVEIFDGLTRVESGRQRVEVTEGRDGASGCPTSVKNVLQLVTEDPGLVKGLGSLPELLASERGRVCRYRVEAPDAAAGTFLAGARLDGDGWRDLVRAVAAPTSTARPCTETPTEIAVVEEVAGGDPAYVELDGCRRILTPDGGLRRAGTDLVALVRRLTPGEVTKPSRTG